MDRYDVGMDAKRTLECAASINVLPDGEGGLLAPKVFLNPNSLDEVSIFVLSFSICL